MLLLSATQLLGCHSREFRAFYSPSTPPFSLFLSREREPRTDRALGLFSSVAEVPHGRPLDPPSHARPIPRNCALRELPHAIRCLTSGRRAPATPTRAAAARSTKTSSSPRRTGQLSPHPPFPCPCRAFSPTTSSSLRSGLG